MGKANVVATGIGYKVINGKVSKDLSIICSVESKKAITNLAAKDIIPKALDNIPLDVYPTGVLSAYQLPNPTLKYRPAPGGSSIGHYQITAGTFGCVVKRDGKRYILSNNHVMANSNDAEFGDDILQPGPFDGGSRSTDVIAKLTDFIPIAWDGGSGGGDNGGGGDGGDSNCPIANTAANILNSVSAMAGRKSRLKAVIENQPGANLVDAAIAEPVNEADILNEIHHLGNINGVIEGTLGMSLQKFGRTTSHTTGTIQQIDVTSTVSYGAGKNATFVNQIMAGEMSAGDRKSVV